MNIVIVDYGMGNLFSVERALQSIGVERPKTTSDPDRLAEAEFVILPGVGAFGDGMAGLTQNGMADALRDHCNQGKPLLGICLGMQMLVEASEESPGVAGLGLIRGQVRRIDSTTENGAMRKVPYVGWAKMAVNPSWGGSDFAWPTEMIAGESFYCVHSFQTKPVDESCTLSSYDYDGLSVTAAIARDNIIGTQFHPEKSGKKGLALLREVLVTAGVSLS